jgi:thiol-disulfide isomerase/thioredoxin
MVVSSALAACFGLNSRSGRRHAGNDRQINSSFRALAIVVATLVASSAFAIDFKPYGRGAFAQLTKAHVGRPLMIHFWSVTCPPCLVELQQWAKMIAERKDVDIVFVNVDSDEDRARAQARAEKAGLGKAVHYGFADDFVEKLYFEADTTWRGELPFTALVSPGGKVTAITGAIDDPLVLQWLEKHH